MLTVHLDARLSSILLAWDPFCWADSLTMFSKHYTLAIAVEQCAKGGW